jgi:hypothetical protein
MRLENKIEKKSLDESLFMMNIESVELSIKKF